MGKSSLIMVLGFMVVFGSIQRRLYQKSLDATDNFVNDYERVAARNIANSAANIVMGRLRNDFSWRPDPNPSPPCPLFGGSYSLLLEDIGDSIRITSTATVNNASHVVRAKLKPTSTYFNQAAFGGASVKLGVASLIDSYDSDLGAYGGANKGSHGGVGSNGNITLRAFATVKGDATAGGSVSLRWGARVTGTKTNGAENVNLAPIDSLVAFHADSAHNDNDEHGLSDVLNLGMGESLTLTSGEYYFTSITLGVGSNLIIDGEVRIYCPGSITARAVSNIGQNPKDLTIFCSDSGPNKVRIGLATDFYGAIYAPNAGIRIIVLGELYGAVIGESVDNLLAARIHYDESLGRIRGEKGNFVSGFSIASWWE